MVLKLLVLMVAVAVLEGVAGLQEKQIANETQIKANPDHKKRGRRLDKLPCIVEDGTCQPKGEPCDGVVRQGPEWCLHHRHFECCYPYGCEMDGVVCPNGAIAEDNCIIFVCLNGCWVFKGWNPFCGFCWTYGKTTLVTFVGHRYSGVPPGVYRYAGTELFGIDICFVTGDCIAYILYYEPGVAIYIFSDGMICVEWDWGPCVPFLPVGICEVQPVSAGFGTVYIYKKRNMFTESIYIIGSYGLSVYVDYYIGGFPCLLNVYAMATPSVQGDLSGLCVADTWPVTPYPLGITWQGVWPGVGITLPGVAITAPPNFVNSWKVRGTRRRNNEDIQKLIKDHALQVTDKTIIEKSMSDIVKSCEEVNEGPCSVLSSDECEILQETCVSRMSNVSGQGDSSDSSE